MVSFLFLVVPNPPGGAGYLFLLFSGIYSSLHIHMDDVVAMALHILLLSSHFIHILSFLDLSSGSVVWHFHPFLQPPVNFFGRKFEGIRPLLLPHASSPPSKNGFIPRGTPANICPLKGSGKEDNGNGKKCIITGIQIHTLFISQIPFY
jgi:hypothetical protein